MEQFIHHGIHDAMIPVTITRYYLCPFLTLTFILELFLLGSLYYPHEHLISSNLKWIVTNIYFCSTVYVFWLTFRFISFIFVSFCVVSVPKYLVNQAVVYKDIDMSLHVSRYRPCVLFCWDVFVAYEEVNMVDELVVESTGKRVIVVNSK
jgi:hypothetical protein